MMSRFSRFCLIAALPAFLSAAQAAPAPTPLGTSRAWSAYEADGPNGKTCYALSKPRASEPRGAHRDPVYLMLSDWPDRRVKGEFEIVPGYPFKADAPATAEIGKERVDLFTRNDAGAGQAWVKDPADEDRLREAMRKGNTMVVTGISDRGTKTRDTYSLDGVSAMLDRVHAACGM